MKETGAENTRIDALEARIAYQDQTIEDLNQSVADLWKKLEELSRQIARFDGRLNAAEGALGEVLPLEPPPPHY